ncbi:MAG: class I SAM-dependent methyltransferase, partial [Patescibacteria group bacterium]|nr:class I SAM-dependent methyltransferase [Patescibacteria group bacterium]
CFYFIKRFSLTTNDLVMEIASNDGTQLQFFKQRGIPVIGIDPAKNIAKFANDKGIPTIAEFFNKKFAIDYLKNKKKKPTLIFGANVLAHVPRIYDFALGLKTILSEKGTAVFEFPYLEGLFENKFDIIYHEHVFYYSLLALQNLFSSVNLTLYDVEKIPMQGGSLRIFVCQNNNFPISKNIKKMIELEKNKKYDRFITYLKIKTNIEKLKKDLTNILVKIRKNNKTIAGYGAAAKGVILMNYFNIGSNYLTFIADQSKEKQGLYVPRILMKVEPPSFVFEKKPDYLLIFAWNLKDEIIKQFKNYQNQGGKFIVPIPSVKII